MSLNLNQLRIATQVRELFIQSYSLENIFKEMEEYWLSLYTTDKRCLIVEQTATKVKHQLVTMYAVRLIKNMSAMVGFDLIPLAYQDPTKHWKTEAVILNISSRKVVDHRDLFNMLAVNLFGVSSEILEFGKEPTWDKVKKYVSTVYGIELGDAPEGEANVVTVEAIDKVINELVNGKEVQFKFY